MTGLSRRRSRVRVPSLPLKHPANPHLLLPNLAHSTAGAASASPSRWTARAENHLRGNPALEDTLARLQAYERAGADCLYAPGLQTTAEIRAVCDALGRPVNVLATPHLSVAEIVEAGAQRISVGGRLAWVAVAAMAAAAEEIRDQRSFAALDVSPPIDRWLGG